MFIRKPTKSKFAPQNIKTKIVEHDENGLVFNTPVNLVSEESSKKGTPNTTTTAAAALIPSNRKVQSQIPGSGGKQGDSKKAAAAGTTTKTTFGTTTTTTSNNIVLSNNTVIPVHFYPATVTSSSDAPPIFIQDTNLEAQNTADSIRLAPGVVYREGETIKKGVFPGRIDVLEYGKSFARGASNTTSTLYKNYVHSAKPDDVLECVLDNTEAKVKPVNLTLKPVT